MAQATEVGHVFKLTHQGQHWIGNVVLMYKSALSYCIVGL